jgi:hypothetical protein
MLTSEIQSTDIERILDQARFHDREIGEYTQHLMLEDGYRCSVRLTNGYIVLFKEEITVKRELPDARIRDIAARFRKKAS